MGEGMWDLCQRCLRAHTRGKMVALIWFYFGFIFICLTGREADQVTQRKLSHLLVHSLCDWNDEMQVSATVQSYTCEVGSQLPKPLLLPPRMHTGMGCRYPKRLLHQTPATTAWLCKDKGSLPENQRLSSFSSFLLPFLPSSKDFFLNSHSCHALS